MTGSARLLRMALMNIMRLGIGRVGIAGLGLAMLAASSTAFAQKDTEEEPTSFVYFLVIKDDNGKAVRNAAVVMHPVKTKGKQERGGMELKTHPEGKANFD